MQQGSVTGRCALRNVIGGAKRNETQCRSSSTVKRNEAEHNIIKLMVGRDRILNSLWMEAVQYAQCEIGHYNKDRGKS